MEAHLQILCCLDCIKSEFTESNANDVSTMSAAQRKHYDEFKQREGKARFSILNALDDSIFPKISGAKSSKAIWDILKAAYQGNEKVKVVKLQTLRTQFETLKMHVKLLISV